MRYGFYGRAFDGETERLAWNERKPPVTGAGAPSIGDVWLDFTGTTAEVDAETERRNCNGAIIPPRVGEIVGPVEPVVVPGCEAMAAEWAESNRRLFERLTREVAA